MYRAYLVFYSCAYLAFKDTFKAAVNIVWILCKSCMFLGAFRFAKNMKFLNKGGIRSISRSLRDAFLYALVLIG